MRKVTIVAVLSLLLASVTCLGQDELSGEIDVTYLTSKIWRGFDYYPDDHSAMETSVDFDLYGSGFGAKIYYARAINGGFENQQDLAGTLYYSNSAMEGQSNQMDYTVGWTYYGYPDSPRSGSVSQNSPADMQEAFATLSWPNMFANGVVPSYTVLSMWPSEGSSAARSNAGWAHIIGLDYGMEVTCPFTDTQRTIDLSAKAIYNDGVAPGVMVTNSGSVDHDWSHAVFGASTDFAFADNMIFTPGLYYQSSWDDSVNSEDEWWASMNLNYSF